MTTSWRVMDGDCVERLSELPDGLAQTCVTSPPYFGLRDYGTGRWDGGDEGCDHLAPPGGGTAATGLMRDGRSEDARQGNAERVVRDRGQQYRETCGKCGATRVDQQVGLEATPDAYVERLVEVFREVRRVLRDDGTVWLNLGDSYASAYACERRNVVGNGSPDAATNRANRLVGGLKEKDLMGIPWMVAFALRADGWYLRSDIVWAKPNPMPESVTDRPTKAHEYVFLLSKSKSYFYDADAIRETDSGRPSGNGFVRDHRLTYQNADGTGRGNEDEWEPGGGRNKRSVWQVATQPFPGAHFAVFPPKLIEPCVLAGSSDRACGVCGQAWQRVVERDRPEPAALRPKDPRTHLGHSSKSTINQSNWHDDRNPTREVRTVGWQPACSCCEHCTAGHEPAIGATCPTNSGSSLVLDPFCGAGTTGVVATRLDRSFVGIELNPGYAEMSRRRIRDDSPLFNWASEGTA